MVVLYCTRKHFSFLPRDRVDYSTKCIRLVDEGGCVAESLGERYHTACIFVLLFVLYYGTIQCQACFFSLVLCDKMYVKCSVEIMFYLLYELLFVTAAGSFARVQRMAVRAYDSKSRKE